MKKFSVETLAAVIKAQPTGNKRAVAGISIDSRTTRPDDCFFAIKGKNFDGHNFIAQALENGAACAVVSEGPARPNILHVDDTIKALGELAKWYRQKNGFKVVAITGSVGKTTTRLITHHVLKQRLPVVTAPKNFNNEIGLPLTILSAEAEDEVIVAELGTNRPGDILYLTQIAQPDIAVITNIQAVHLQGLQSCEHILREKLFITQGLKPGGSLIINGDCGPLLKACNNVGLNFTTFGTVDGCEIKATDIKQGPTAGTFTIEGQEVFLPVPGTGNVENAVAAYAICHKFGVTAKQFTDAVKTFSAPPMRTEIISVGGIKIINDCYNASPASTKNALGILENLKTNLHERLVFICGDMKELGDKSDEFHNELGKDIVEAGVSLLIATGDFAQTVTKAAQRFSRNNIKAICFGNTTEAVQLLRNHIKENDIVLVKGSRSCQLEVVTEKLKGLFSKDTKPKTIQQIKEVPGKHDLPYTLESA